MAVMVVPLLLSMVLLLMVMGETVADFYAVLKAVALLLLCPIAARQSP